MHESKQETAAKTNFHHLQPTVEQQPEALASQETLSPQQNPLVRGINRVGNTPSANIHATMLNRSAASQNGAFLRQLQRQYGNSYVQRVLALSRKANGEAEAAPEVEEAIQRNRGNGQSLDGKVQAQMESAFGVDFGGVRVHTDAEADTLNRALDARAFTTGQDIFFRQGEYNPSSSSGRELLAHELTHVVQQTGGIQPKLTISQPGDRDEQEADQVAQAIVQQEQKSVLTNLEENGSPSQMPIALKATTSHHAAPAIRRWAQLGSWSWDNPFTSSRVTVAVKVGTEEEWLQQLKNMDDEEEFRYYLQGFLEAITDPQATTRKSHPLGFSNYSNELSRRPNTNEILAFMRALYSLGDDLDLPTGGFEMSGVNYYYLQELLSKAIIQYQGLWIEDVSHGSPTKDVSHQKEKNFIVPKEGIRGVAKQTGSQVRINMILSGGATAMKGVDLVATANTMPTETSAQQDAKTLAKHKAFETIRNAGRTIRYTLTEHEAVVAANQAVLKGVFESVWEAVPGGGALSSVAKEALKIGFSKMIEGIANDDNPTNQVERINTEFVNHVNQLVPKYLNEYDSGIAIASFEAVRR